MKDMLLRQIQISGNQEPFHLADLAHVRNKVLQWRHYFPHIEPFYAMKCNPDPIIIQTLRSLGVGFDCASMAEIQCTLNAGAAPEKVVYSNTVKQDSHLEYARSVGVKMMTFDNHAELMKIKAIYPTANLLLRIRVADSHSEALGAKFGAMPNVETLDLLQASQSLDLNVVGVSFHVCPSDIGCQMVGAYKEAIASARSVFDEAESQGMYLKILDIGGGFPGTDDNQVTFAQIAWEIREAIHKHFPSTMGIRIIAEPGRYFVTTSQSMACNIISKKIVNEGDESFMMYYVNEGVYGSFLDRIMYQAEYYPKVLSSKTSTDFKKQLRCIIWGRTCDGMDEIVPLEQDCYLPELDVGDWLYFDNMGAYTTATGTQFNGFAKSVTHHVFSAAVQFDVGSLPKDFPNLETEVDPAERFKLGPGRETGMRRLSIF